MPRFLRRTERLWLPVLSAVLTLLLLEAFAWFVPMGDNVAAEFSFVIRDVDGDVEAGYNQEDPYVMWSAAPGYDDGTIRINEFGMRGNDTTREKPKGLVRVLALGDSSTFGHGVKAEEIYHSVLQRGLHARGIPVEVLNAGVTGYTSTQGLAWYHYFGRHFDPDLILFYFGPNDVKGSGYHLSDSDILRRAGPSMVKAFKQSILLKLRSYRALRRLTLGIRRKLNPPQHDIVPRVGALEFGANLRALHEQATAAGARVVVISPPTSAIDYEEWGGHVNLTTYRRVLASTVEALDIPFVEVPEMLPTSRSKAQGQWFLDRFHPSPAGHRLLGERLVAVVEQMHK